MEIGELRAVVGGVGLLGVHPSNEEGARRIIVLDTSATTPSCSSGLSAKLYTGWRGLMSLSPECVEESIRRVASLEDLFARNEVIVLPQVIREMRAHLKAINVHIDWFLKRRDGRAAIEKIGRRGYARRMDGLTHTLARLRAWSDSFYGLLRLAERSEYALGFRDPVDPARLEAVLSAAERAAQEPSLAAERRADPVEWMGRPLAGFTAYCGYLQAAVERSGDDRRKAHRRAASLRQPNPQGLVWHTDRHVVAAACAISEHRPVTVLSNDHGLSVVLARALAAAPRAGDVSFAHANEVLA